MFQSPPTSWSIFSHYIYIYIVTINYVAIFVVTTNQIIHWMIWVSPQAPAGVSSPKSPDTTEGTKNGGIAHLKISKKKTWSIGIPIDIEHILNHLPSFALNQIKIMTSWWFFATPLKKIRVRQLGWFHSQFIWENKKCFKPPTSWSILSHDRYVYYIWKRPSNIWEFISQSCSRKSPPSSPPLDADTGLSRYIWPWRWHFPESKKTSLILSD